MSKLVNSLRIKSTVALLFDYFSKITNYNQKKIAGKVLEFCSYFLCFIRGNSYESINQNIKKIKIS